MQRIILIGYMGAGKTTVGKALAHDLGLEFFDLDWYIENRFRKKIPQIFAERGENGFREIERNMLYEVGEFENVVISSGGGTPCFFDNIDYMSRQADTVYLNAPVDVLYAHLMMGKSQRPLIEGKTPEELKAYIKDSLAGREQFYRKARYMVDVEVIRYKSQIQALVDNIKEIIATKNQKEDLLT